MAAVAGDGQQRRAIGAGLLQESRRLCRVLHLDGLDIEKCPRRFQEFSLAEALQAGDHAVRGQDHQALTVHVDEGHHHPIVGRFAGRGRHRVLLATFPLVVERGLVAVMAVGDDQLGTLHALEDEFDQARNRPEAMAHVVFVAHLKVGGMARHLGQGIIDLAGRLVVQHENLPKVRLGGSQQLQSVGLGSGVRLLMPEDHAGLVGLELAQTNESSPFHALLRTRDGEFLLVGVKDGIGILNQNALLAPVGERRRGAAIDVLAVVPSFALSQNDAHQVVGTGSVIALLHLRRDLIVGLGYDFRQRHSRGVIAQGGEGEDFGHVRCGNRSIVTSGAENLSGTVCHLTEHAARAVGPMAGGRVLRG